MIEVRIGGILFRFSLLFPAVVVLLLAWDKSGVMAWCLLFSVLHEAGHFLMMLILRSRPEKMTVSAFGIRVEHPQQTQLNYGQNVLVSLAGPAVNFLLAGIMQVVGFHIPALISLIIGIFNLLPIEPLDGGQALLHALCLRMPQERAGKIVLIVSVCFLFPLVLLGALFLLISGYNYTLLLLAIYLSLLLIIRCR